MAAVLIQVSGHAVAETADPRYRAHTQGTRFCDEPLQYGTYFNASPFWQREGFGRRAAWETIAPGDEVALYCTGSVDEHGACLSHLLTVETVTLDEQEGARLTFADRQELVPKIPYSDIQTEIANGRLSERMNYCGQEGFNITEIPPRTSPGFASCPAPVGRPTARQPPIRTRRCRTSPRTTSRSSPGNRSRFI